MKNTLFALAILTTLIVSSCSKSNDNNNPVVTLPKTYTEDIRSSAFNSLTTYNLTYDGNYRLVSMVAVPDPPVAKFIFQYPTSLTVTMDMYTGATLSIHENFWLNAASFADSTLQYNDTQDTTTEKYIYNANNLLLKVNSYDYHTSGTTLSKTTTYNYDANGNATTQTDNPGGIITFTYYVTLNTFSIGNSFIPQPKNLVRSATLDNGGTPITTMHYYGFDSNNRLIKDTITVSGSDLVVLKSYTY
jgi:YD repeat-containing protein